jgi:hypothetical protein
MLMFFWHLPTRPHGAKTQSNIIIIVVVIIISALGTSTFINTVSV